MCLAQRPQHSDAGEARTRGPLVSSQALYHSATALPYSRLVITDPDEAAAILNGGNTHDQAGNPPTLPRSEGNQNSPTLPRSEGPMQGETPKPQKPRNSPGLTRLGHTRPKSTPQLMSGPQWSKAIEKPIAWSHQKQHPRNP